MRVILNSLKMKTNWGQPDFIKFWPIQASFRLLRCYNNDILEAFSITAHFLCVFSKLQQCKCSDNLHGVKVDMTGQKYRRYLQVIDTGCISRPPARSLPSWGDSSPIPPGPWIYQVRFTFKPVDTFKSWALLLHNQKQFLFYILSYL